MGASAVVQAPDVDVGSNNSKFTISTYGLLCSQERWAQIMMVHQSFAISDIGPHRAHTCLHGSMVRQAQQKLLTKNINMA